MPPRVHVACVTVHAIINPRSQGGRTGTSLPQLESRLRGAFPGLTIHQTERRRHATSLAREATEAGASQLVVVGGDGTWHEVVHGCLEADRPAPLLSLVPRGTGGDMRRSLGVPQELDAALARAQAGRVRVIDAGRLTWRTADGATGREFFANIASIGMSADVATRTDTGTVTKARLGPLAFLLEGLGAALRPQRHPVRITLDDGPAIATEVGLCAVSNGRTFGGGMTIAPMADLTDGRLDVVWIEALPRASVLALLPSVYPGWHHHLPWVHHRRASRVTIELLAPCHVEADGELPGASGVLTFEVLPGAVRVT